MTTRHFHSTGTCILAASMLIALACGVDDPPGEQLPDVDCTAPPAFAEVSAFSACTICHASTLQSTSRAGAPTGVDYDTYQAAVANAERAAIRVFAGTMPPVGSVSDAGKEQLYTWALCGTPP